MGNVDPFSYESRYDENLRGPAAARSDDHLRPENQNEENPLYGTGMFRFPDAQPVTYSRPLPQSPVQPYQQAAEPRLGAVNGARVRYRTITNPLAPERRPRMHQQSAIELSANTRNRNEPAISRPQAFTDPINQSRTFVGQIDRQEQELETLQYRPNRNISGQQVSGRYISTSHKSPYALGTPIAAPSPKLTPTPNKNSSEQTVFNQVGMHAVTKRPCRTVHTGEYFSSPQMNQFVHNDPDKHYKPMRTQQTVPPYSTPQLPLHHEQPGYYNVQPLASHPTQPYQVQRPNNGNHQEISFKRAGVKHKEHENLHYSGRSRSSPMTDNYHVDSEEDDESQQYYGEAAQYPSMRSPQSLTVQQGLQQGPRPHRKEACADLTALNQARAKYAHENMAKFEFGRQLPTPPSRGLGAQISSGQHNSAIQHLPQPSAAPRHLRNRHQRHRISRSYEANVIQKHYDQDPSTEDGDTLITSHGETTMQQFQGMSGPPSLREPDNLSPGDPGFWNEERMQQYREFERRHVITRAPAGRHNSDRMLAAQDENHDSNTHGSQSTLRSAEPEVRTPASRNRLRRSVSMSQLVQPRGVISFARPYGQAQLPRTPVPQPNRVVQPVIGAMAVVGPGLMNLADIGTKTDELKLEMQEFLEGSEWKLFVKQPLFIITFNNFIARIEGFVNKMVLGGAGERAMFRGISEVRITPAYETVGSSHRFM